MLCRDVLQIDSRMLLSRKIALVMRTVDPVVLQQAGVGIYHGLLGKCACRHSKVDIYPQGSHTSCGPDIESPPSLMLSEACEGGPHTCIWVTSLVIVCCRGSGIDEVKICTVDFSWPLDW